MNYLITTIRANPWVFLGALVGISWLIGNMTKGAGFLKSVAGQLLAAALAFGVTAGVGAYGHRVEAKAARNTQLEGSFTASGGELGAWTVSPSRCLEGKERGFEGVLFMFEDGPVKELRVDLTRKKQSSVSVRLDDEESSLVQLRERDCQVLSGERRVSNRLLNGRNVRRLRGSVRIVCPGLKGQARFDGCLPETAESLFGGN